MRPVLLIVCDERQRKLLLLNEFDNHLNVSNEVTL
jgi:hypothetical protein